MKKIKTQKGIAIEIDERIVEDTRLYQYMADMQDEDTSVRLVAVYGLLAFMFGGSKGARQFQDAVAEVNGGVCTQEALLEEIKEVLELLKGKN